MPSVKGTDMDPDLFLNTIVQATKHPASQVQLDWRAYFMLFCEHHGGSPIHFGGRLLFADGWSYSSTDYAGPEWMPPTDPLELRELMRAYWMRRKAIVFNEARELRQEVIGLQEMQSVRKVPLQHATTNFDQETGKLSMTRGDLDLTDMIGRLSWLEEDVVECGNRLKELEDVGVQAGESAATPNP